MMLIRRKKFSGIKKFAALSVVACMALLSLRQDGRAMIVPAEMIHSSPQIAGTFNRQEDLTKIRKVLEHKLVSRRLSDAGLTQSEIKERLDKLSDRDVHQLASQMDSILPAGDAGGTAIAVLVIAVLVLLIVYLVKRV